MSILPVFRDGPPEAAVSVVIFCDICSEPITSKDNAFATRWTEMKGRNIISSTPYYFFHSMKDRPCLSMAEKQVGKSNATTHVSEFLSILDSLFKDGFGSKQDEEDAKDSSYGVRYWTPAVYKSMPFRSWPRIDTTIEPF